MLPPSSVATPPEAFEYSCQLPAYECHRTRSRRTLLIRSQSPSRLWAAFAKLVRHAKIPRVLVGHYAAAFVLKSRSKAVSLGWLFVGVQFADLLFLPLVLVGIERMRIVENSTFRRRSCFWTRRGKTRSMSSCPDAWKSTMDGHASAATTAGGKSSTTSPSSRSVSAVCPSWSVAPRLITT